jgi:NhaP-type Na+/H+ or K+/H+ antiporter
MGSSGHCLILSDCSASCSFSLRSSVSNYSTTRTVISIVLLLSATLTATDTVAVLALLKKSKFPKVHTIIFGEGILNDAVAIILFKITLKINNHSDQMNVLSAAGVTQFLKTFVVVTILSIILGLAIGYLFLYTVGS